MNARRKIIYIDEVCFSKHTTKTSEWSGRRDNIYVPCESMKVGFHAVIAAISYDGGIEHFEVLEEAANNESFAAFAENLFSKFDDQKITVVLDNLAVHFHDNVKEVYNKHDVYYIRNVPYCPQFNPIEFVFAQIKKSFKEMKLSSLAAGESFD